MENGVYLFAAYSIVWIAVFGYVFYLHWKQRKLFLRIDSLEEHTKKDMPK